MSHLNNRVKLFSFAALLLTSSCSGLHKIALSQPEEMFSYFSYGSDRKIISGHRGGMENGMPENSLETFKATLKETPAFFEIDPRLTKDSVIVLMHDATLDRTTTGTGKLADYTYAELKDIRLKDKDGNATPYKIPRLEEVIKWGRGKTVLNLDKKDVPFQMIADLIKRTNSNAFVMLTVHSPEETRFYLEQDPKAMFSAHIKDEKTFKAYKDAGIPFKQMIAYIGPKVGEQNEVMYKLLHAEDVMCMISAAPTYDKLSTVEERFEGYKSVLLDGASILESDNPIEASKAFRLLD
ncbi:glycerophosphodiester phosphodiesterase family protein [Sphingobacterium sp. UT-1RO-CII-1]|uniref:glycerophosphodiester phosphodiesterase family protein n=1 Tax=Sphingobacterium sp. UT-1RO-CII-1 TaxID=2995225 RepID=UPI00227A0151|nr:glycerophosphodiester phosphodiesterase family protein [Sphingobacterium sp. UT-1RO-CII-1]MCY4778420.1 glycerophosphodiester phosphodiesterase family protein [Sphingobacterium sp. UT-1RO-CII-1]